MCSALIGDVVCVQLIAKCNAKITAEFDQWYDNLHSKSAAALSAMNTHTSAYSDSNGEGQGVAYSGDSSFAAQNKYPPEQRGERATAKQSDDKSADSRQADLSNNYSGASARAPLVMSDDGDDVNEDIAAFYQAKEEMLKRRQG